MMPKDPVMLLSYVNTQLRDFYPSLAEFCAAMQTEESDLREKLALPGGNKKRFLPGQGIVGHRLKRVTMSQTGIRCRHAEQALQRNCRLK